MVHTGNMAQVLPEYLCNWTTKKVQSTGVDVVSNRRVVGASISDGDNKVALALDNGDTVTTDYVLGALARIESLQWHTGAKGENRWEHR